MVTITTWQGSDAVRHVFATGVTCRVEDIDGKSHYVVRDAERRYVATFPTIDTVSVFAPLDP